MDNIYAYTAPFASYPEYVNLSGQDNGSTILSVRTQGDQIASVINMPPGELIKLGQAMVSRGLTVLNMA
jgi:hypothetical protein